MLHLLRILDKATGYIFMPPSSTSSPSPKGPSSSSPQPSQSSSSQPNGDALFSSIAGRIPGSDVRDVQERWIDSKDAYDEHERAEWKAEGDRASGKGGAGGGGVV